ncbi:MAG: HAD family hydrolase [Clostridia bacterium]|nr:HAD family hydrolase [Clostridia bacterium]
MKTLYAADLDGTLLRSDETLSAYTCQTINELVEQGMLFTYATARSYITASRATKGLTARIPLIVYNGAFIVDNLTGEILRASRFDGGISGLLDDLLSCGIYPIVYAIIGGKETFSYVDHACTPGMRQFVESRRNDPRKRPLTDVQGLYEGDVFYVTCIGEESVLKPMYMKYRDVCRCVYHRDIYTKVQWLEMMPIGASKANAVRWLQSHLGCDRLVVFGDGKNDVDMFEIADIGCAMENAEDELKSIATYVIGSNDDDGVARWIRAYAE